MGNSRTLSAVLAATVVLGASIAISATAPSQLSGISGLKVWLDAADINGDGTPTTDGAGVGSWKDKASGIAFDQGTENLKPMVVANGINGLPVVRFVRPDQNSAQYLSGNDSVISTLFDNSNTAFVVARANAGCGDSGSQDPPVRLRPRRLPQRPRLRRLSQRHPILQLPLASEQRRHA